METSLITYRNSVINVYFFGQGESYLFCFHGYGEEGSSFKVLEPGLGKMYSLIAIDLPFHGGTSWNNDLLMSPADLWNIMNEILKERTGSDAASKKFSLLAYSFSGRIALQLLELIPSRIDRVVLLAPDGLRTNFWHWLGTQTFFGNRLFAFTVRNPGWLFALMTFGNKTGLLNKSIFKFARFYLDDEHERKLLYRRWTSMRKFKPGLHAVKKVIATYKIPVRFLFGSYDKIILHKSSKLFKAGKQNIKVEVIDAGHQLLQEKYAHSIALLFSR